MKAPRRTQSQLAMIRRCIFTMRSHADMLRLCRAQRDTGREPVAFWKDDFAYWTHETLVAAQRWRATLRTVLS